jgi:hypothetical protein
MRQIHSNFAFIFGGLVRGVCLLDCIRKNTYHRAPKPGLVTLRPEIGSYPILQRTVVSVLRSQESPR